MTITNNTFLHNIPRKMRLTGMLVFRNGFLNACYGEKFLCVIQVAHAAEILLKARIAQENLLSIFLRPSEINLKNNLTQLEWLELVEEKHTIKYSYLPNKLKEVTGINIDIERCEQYKKFGRLRNALVHLGWPTKQALDEVTIRYSLELLDPLVESFWGRSVFDFIKYDLMSEGCSFLASGFLETKIKEVLPIDARLRRVLGETSEKNIEFMENLQNLPELSIENLNYSYDDSLYDESINYYEDNNLSEEEIKKYEKYMQGYDEYIKANPEVPPDVPPSYGELIEYWENFLNSF